MSAYQAGKLLFQMQHDSELRSQFQADSDAVLDRYELTPDERKALLNKDVGYFYKLGINPLLLIATSWTLGVSMPEYRAAIAGVQRHI